MGENRPFCKECRHRMRRLYVKPSYFFPKDHDVFIPVGWICLFCNKINVTNASFMEKHAMAKDPRNKAMSDAGYFNFLIIF